MSAVLLLGFLLGMRHALDSDHVAAVASLVARRLSLSRTLVQGAVWGLGHAVTLLVAYSLVLFLDVLVPERIAQSLEALVGAMLVVLGADVLRRMWRRRIHVHAHRHADGTLHLHAHSHAGESQHDDARHEHRHPGGFPLRALGVGMVHGLAGTAALILLAPGDVPRAVGLVYVALFGVGATLGMAVLSVVIALPLRWSARRLGRVHNALLGTVGMVTIAIGGLMLLEYATIAAPSLF